MSWQAAMHAGRLTYADFQRVYLSWQPCPRGVERVHACRTFGEFVGRMDCEAFCFAAVHVQPGFQILLRDIARSAEGGGPITGSPIWTLLLQMARVLFLDWAEARGLMRSEPCHETTNHHGET